VEPDLKWNKRGCFPGGSNFHSALNRGSWLRTAKERYLQLAKRIGGSNAELIEAEDKYKHMGINYRRAGQGRQEKNTLRNGLPPSVVSSSYLWALRRGLRIPV